MPKREQPKEAVARITDNDGTVVLTREQAIKRLQRLRKLETEPPKD
jgi:hypothetical protein